MKGHERARAKRKAAPSAPEGVLEGVDASLLDIVDHVLNQGIVVTGDLLLGVADVDLVYLRASVVLCAADRLLGAAARKGRRHAGKPPLLGTGARERARRR
ncbi:MAG: gas vesicle protein [Deltaproteobacteria bacterium]|nr:gas vesicle protein [Deltaproteobacteria bacterium]